MSFLIIRVHCGPRHWVLFKFWLGLENLHKYLLYELLIYDFQLIYFLIHCQVWNDSAIFYWQIPETEAWWVNFVQKSTVSGSFRLSAIDILSCISYLCGVLPFIRSGRIGCLAASMICTLDASPLTYLVLTNLFSKFTRFLLGVKIISGWQPL